MSVHLTPEILRAYRRGQLSRGELLDLAFDHLPEVCPHCREGFAVLEAEPVPADAVLLLGSWSILLARFGPGLAAEEDRAFRDVAQLRRLPSQERRGRIERAYRRFRGGSFVELLLAECRRHLHEDPKVAHHWAELAWVAAYESPGLPADVAALTRAEMANALRAGGDLAGADRIFEHVRQLGEHGPVRDLQVVARICCLEGSLRKDQRKFDAARKLLGRSLGLCRIIGDEEGAVQALITVADTFFYQGQVEWAIEKIRRVLEILPDRPSKLRLWARHNLTCYLVSVGQHEEAAELRAEDEPLSRESFEAIDQIRLAWLDSRVAAEGGELERAAEVVSGVVTSFLEKDISFGAAMGARDLVLILDRLGRTSEAEVLARRVARKILSSGADNQAIASLQPYLKDPPEGVF
jgi:tetratricopeptide (TPR) repeat protein